ncbi:hypothetical protein [Aquisalimonas sp.]|uniref:hypothetical protein n=1 Tax=unclassified Aquisalimonas TaxID=2644645 RepID=UPI0025C35EE6|nr:hypothetical protein [Aquisalimonas sp.]
MRMTVVSRSAKGLVFASFSAMVLGGCAMMGGQQEAEETDPMADQRVMEPDWYMPGNNDAGDGGVYGYGQGESESRRLAESQAQAEARRSVATAIAGESAGVLEETSGDMDGDVVETAREAYESFFDQELYGVEVDRRELLQDPDTSEYRAFYRVRVEGEIFDAMLEAAMNDEQLSSTIPQHDDAMEALDERRD